MSQYIVTHADSGFGEMTTIGLPYYFDNRTTKWSIWNLNLFLDYVEVTLERSEKFIKCRPKLHDNTSPVMIKLVLKINPEVFDYGVEDNVKFQITTELLQPGYSSYSMLLKMRKGDKLLVERFSKLGYIDNSTRRAVPNSEGFLKEFSKLRGQGFPQELSRTEIPVRPADSFEWKVTTRYSDCDANMHVNQCLYIKSCFDCATFASLTGKLIHFDDDILWYPIYYLSVNYLGECMANDELTVYMWQDKCDCSLLKFSVCKQNSQITFIECRLGLTKMKGYKLSRL